MMLIEVDPYFINIRIWLPLYQLMHPFIENLANVLFLLRKGRKKSSSEFLSTFIFEAFRIREGLKKYVIFWTFQYPLNHHPSLGAREIIFR